MNTPFPQRKTIRLKGYDYGTPGAYFVTICTHNRAKCLWNAPIDRNRFHWEITGERAMRPRDLPLSEIGHIVAEELEKWEQMYPDLILHSYIIMDDHLHFVVRFCGDGQTELTLIRLIQQFKGAVTKRGGAPVWQRSFMEHVIKTKEESENIANYIYRNPLNRGERLNLK